MLRHSFEAHTALGDRYDLDALTELLLGAVTEAAQQVATAAAPVKAARRYSAQLRTMIDSIVRPAANR